jgi:hypothetical protein
VPYRISRKLFLTGTHRVERSEHFKILLNIANGVSWILVDYPDYQNVSDLAF